MAAPGTENPPEPEAPAARTLIELEDERRRNEAIAIRLSAYADKGVLTAEELGNIKAEFPVALPRPSIVLENDDIPSDRPCALKRRASFHEGNFERQMNIVRKHFPDAKVLTKKEAGTGKDVIAVVGVDAETLNSVIKMEATRDKAVERVKEIDERTRGTAKEMGAGGQIVDIEKLSKAVDDLARRSGANQSQMDESHSRPSPTPQGRRRGQHRSV
jgi:hypothetical protein